ncbi:MAG TPA: hypothetical protein VKP30_05375 [Polyangiaceae bacterium]|nr:hypothetical protein [Polyangiaceae bacterium]
MKVASVLLPTTALAPRVLAPPKSVLAQKAARGWEERKGEVVGNGDATHMQMQRLVVRQIGNGGRPLLVNRR